MYVDEGNNYCDGGGDNDNDDDDDDDDDDWWPTFRALALRQRECDEGLTLETSAIAWHFPHRHTIDTPVCLPPRRRSQPSSLKIWHYTVGGRAAEHKGLSSVALRKS